MKKMKNEEIGQLNYILRFWMMDFDNNECCNNYLRYDRMRRR